MMVMKSVKNCLTGTIVNITTKTGGNLKKLSGQDNISCCEHGMATHYLFGENLLMPLDNKELIAPFSETKANINQVTLSDRLTPLLIFAGLVKGIIPLSMRKKSNQLTLDVVLKWPDGKFAGKPKCGD